ncbi:MAG: protein phosphatase 2C domain-containing protein [Gammaproteobacteria bacterium]|nr:protein phosphatase 2C domain-containing protein [Gammaproteobacteria bacterium]
MQAVGRSWQGIRSRNEDVYTIRTDLNLVAVADGMGGAPGGNIASRLTIDEFSDSLENCKNNGGSKAKDLVDAAVNANSLVNQRPAMQPELTGMGSTIVAALFRGEEIDLCHVGDSRAYLYRKKNLTQITQDHSVIQGMISRGEVTAEEAENLPIKHALTQAIGPSSKITPELNHVLLGQRDVLLLCSDGLCGFVPEEEICDILSAHGHSLRTAMNVLVESAMKFGSTDNITVVLAKL